MTPTELLAPQPSPVRTERSQSVTDFLLSETVNRRPMLAALLRARRDQGIERYGAELTTHNGRSARCEALQEAVDLAVYLGQETLEAPTEWEREAAAFDFLTVERLIHRILERAQ